MYQVSYLSVCPSLTIYSISGVYVHTNRIKDMFALGQCTLFQTRSPFIALPATFRNPHPKYIRTVELQQYLRKLVHYNFGGY